MNGETDLATLLRTAAPQLMPGDFVFVSVPTLAAAMALSPVGTFREAEGTTAICAQSHAVAAGLTSTGPFRQITLTVHSSLAAVGFFAALTTELARHGIPCNAISAFYHDYLFVPSQEAERALQVLQRLGSAASDGRG